MEQKKTIEEWQNFINDLIDLFYKDNVDEEFIHDYVFDTINSLNKKNYITYEDVEELKDFVEEVLHEKFFLRNIGK